MKVKLGELTKIRTGKLDANAASENGKYPFFTCSKEPLRISTYSYDCECVLVAGNGDLNVKYYNGKFDAYQRTYIIESNSNGRLHLPYLYYFMTRYIQELRKLSIGGVIKYIKLGNLTDAEISLPSIKEQKDACEKLKKVKDIIDKKEAQISYLDNLIKARFIEMFENDNMNEKTIEDVASFCSRGKSPKYVTESKLKVINQACIYWDRFKFENVKYNEEDYDGDRIISNNDLLICSTGTGTLGRCNIFRAPDDSRYMADSHVTIIRLNGHILPEVFKAWFERSRTQEKLYSDCVSGSTNQIELSKEKLKNMNILVPPINLQKQFASFAKQVDKSKFVLSNELTMCDFYIRLIHDRVMHSRINLRVAQ